MIEKVSGWRHAGFISSLMRSRYHFSKSISSANTVSRLRKKAMMIPRPTAASAAASAMMKSAKTWPATSPYKRENATRLMFTALRISSMDMSTTMTLRRVTTPTTPMMKSARLRNKYCPIGSIAALRSLLGHDHGPNHSHQQQDRSNLKGQQIRFEQAASHGFRIGRQLRGSRSSQHRQTLPWHFPGSPEHQANLASERHRDDERHPLLPRELDLLKRHVQIDEHDHEDKQNHDAADVKNNLDDEQKLRAQLQENSCSREQRGDQENGAMHHVAARHHEHGADHGDPREEIK